MFSRFRNLFSKSKTDADAETEGDLVEEVNEENGTTDGTAADVESIKERMTKVLEDIDQFVMANSIQAMRAETSTSSDAAHTAVDASTVDSIEIPQVNPVGNGIARVLEEPGHISTEGTGDGCDKAVNEAVPVETVGEHLDEPVDANVQSPAKEDNKDIIEELNTCTKALSNAEDSRTGGNLPNGDSAEKEIAAAHMQPEENSTLVNSQGDSDPANQKNSKNLAICLNSESIVNSEENRENSEEHPETHLNSSNSENIDGSENLETSENNENLENSDSIKNSEHGLEKSENLENLEISEDSEKEENLENSDIVNLENSENIENLENSEMEENLNNSENVENLENSANAKNLEHSDDSENFVNSENSGKEENLENSDIVNLENSENVENLENSEKVENLENLENLENSANVENRENCENMINVEKSVTVENVENVDNVDNVENVESVEDVENSLTSNNFNDSSVIVEDLTATEIAGSPTADSGHSSNASNETPTPGASGGGSGSDRSPTTIVVNPTGSNGIACNAISSKLQEIAEVAEALDAVIRDVQNDTDAAGEAHLLEMQASGAAAGTTADKKQHDTMRSNSSEDCHSRSTEDDSFATASEGNFTSPHSHTHSQSSSFQTASGRTSSFISSGKNSFDASEADDSTFAFELPELNSPISMSFDGSEHSFLSAQQQLISPAAFLRDNDNDVDVDDDDDDQTHELSSVAGIEELHSESVTPTPDDNLLYTEGIPVESETELDLELQLEQGVDARVRAPPMDLDMTTEMQPATMTSVTPEVSACSVLGCQTLPRPQSQLQPQQHQHPHQHLPPPPPLPPHQPQPQPQPLPQQQHKPPNAAWRRSKYYENITKQTIKGFL